MGRGKFSAGQCGDGVLSPLLLSWGEMSPTETYLMVDSHLLGNVASKGLRFWCCGLYSQVSIVSWVIHVSRSLQVSVGVMPRGCRWFGVVSCGTV